MRLFINCWFIIGLTFGIVLSFFEANAQVSEIGIPESFRLVQKKAVIIPTLKLDSVRVQKMIESDKKFRIDNRYGVVQQHEINIKEAGVKTEIQGKGIIWQYKIESADAFSLGIFFKTYHLPRNAKVFIYDSSKTQIRGAFTSKNNNSGQQLPVAEFPGNNLVIEYFEPASPEFSGELVLGSVIQAYTNFQNDAIIRIGINCPEGNNWKREKSCVALMTFNDAQYAYFCTGSLLNNVKEDETPYFMTANHCISTEAVAKTLLTYFNFENSTCTSDDAVKTQTISGATFLSGSNYSDFSLLLLKEYPPDEYNPFYAGWDARGTNSSSGVCIHHPVGEPKCIAIDSLPIISYPDKIKWSFGVSTTLADTHWRVQFDQGYPESGSSGGPLFDQNKRIIGQLHGGYNSVMLFGKFSLSWDFKSSHTEQLAHWLDPGSTTKILDGIWKLRPKSNFRVDFKEVCSGSPVLFYDESQFNPTDWLWQIEPSSYNFINGTDSTSQNPQISFLKDGNYSVSLYTSNKYGRDKLTQQNYILAKSKLDVRLLRVGSDNRVCGCDLNAFPLIAKGAVTYNFKVDKADLIDTKSDSDTLFMTLKASAEYTKSFDTWVRVTGTNGSCTATDSLLLHVIIQPNDNIANAAKLHLGRNTRFSNECATVEKNEPSPAPSCSGENSWCPNPSGSYRVLNNSIWFTFISPSNGLVSINTSGFDDQIAVYKAPSYQSILMDNNSDFTILAANDNRSATDNTALIKNLVLEPGKQYWLQVDGDVGTYGDIVIDLLSNSLEVFPNPSKGIFNLSISNPEAGIASVIVSDLNGRKLFAEQYPVSLTSNKFDIDLSGFSKGIYLINVQINGSNLSKKLVLF